MRRGLFEPQTVWWHLVERRSCHPVPSHYPMELLTPDIRGQGPLADGFYNYPKTDFPRVINDRPVGEAGNHDDVPAWGPGPPGLGNNAFVDAVNAELGGRVDPACRLA